MKRTVIKAAIASLLVGLSVLSALALNVDQTRTMQQRYFGSQQVHYYRVTWSYTDPGIGTAQKFGALAKNTFISSISCYVTQAFTASTKTLQLGYDAVVGTQLMAASGGGASVDLSSATYQAITSAAGLGLKITSAGDVTLYSKLINTGGTTTAGSVTCVIFFEPNNDM